MERDRGEVIKGFSKPLVALFLCAISTAFSCTDEKSVFDGGGADGGTDAGQGGLTCEPDKWGPHGIGYMETTYTDAARSNRPLPVVIYYPAAAKPDFKTCWRTFIKTDSLNRIAKPAFCAVKDAAVDPSGAPYPVVVVSHGNGSMKEAHSFENEYLASHGFVAVAVDHTGNVGPTQGSPADELMTVTRALDVSFVLTEALKAFQAGAGLPAGLGDPDRVGVMGHSWGGHTALSVSGIKYSFDVIQDDCDNHREPDKWYCPLLQRQDQINNQIPDKRIKVTVTYAHDAGHQVSGPNCKGGYGVTNPWLQMLGDTDHYVSVQQDGYDCYDKAGGPACIVVLKGAGHMGFTSMGDDGTLGEERMFDLVRWYTAAFFRYHLAGDKTCADALAGTKSTSWNQGFNDHEMKCRAAK